MDGLIVKSVGGFYHVKTEAGTYLCRARGLFKKQGLSPTVGDLVDMEVTHEGDREGIVREIRPRTNLFVRPPISNVELLLVMVAAKDPDPNFPVIDKFLVTGEEAEVPMVLVVNKADLVTEEEAEAILSVYRPLYDTCLISCETGQGLDELREKMKGRRTALAGPSGVGKSSLLNTWHEEADAKTGAISAKTGRGRHTTRHVEIFFTEDGMVYDTPGFTALDVPDMEVRDLPECFPEMRPYLGQCRFDNCRHMAEPDCRVREALEEGKIHPRRYESYRTLVEELSARKTY